MASKFSVPGVEATTPLAQAAPAMLNAKAAPFFDLEDAARSGADVEAVHDMRVASRRLREAMRLFAPLYAGKGFSQWYRRVRHVTRALGPVRDADVFIETFGKLAPKLGDGGRRAVAFLVGQRLGLREADLARLNSELASLDLVRERREFGKLVRAVRDETGLERTLSDFAYSAVAERAAVVLRLQPDAIAVERVAQQHELRILYKHLRYAVEIFATCYGDSFEALHATLTGFQESLGDLHDNHLFLDLVDRADVAEAAARGGVSADDIAELRAHLQSLADNAYGRFLVLATAHPGASLLPELLVPLTLRPAPAPAPEADAETPESAADAAGTPVAGSEPGSESGPGEQAPSEPAADTEVPSVQEQIDHLLDVHVVADDEKRLPYLDDSGELVLPDDDFDVAAWSAPDDES